METDWLNSLAQAVIGGGANPAAAPMFAGAPIPPEEQVTPRPSFARPQIAPPQVPGTVVDNGGLLARLQQALASGTIGGMPTGTGPTVPPAPTPPAMRPVAPPAIGPASRPAQVSEAGGEWPAFFRRLFAGAASVNPTSPKVSAFAQGAAGAMLTQQAEKERAQKMEAQKARQAFDDKLKVRRDAREERRSSRDDEKEARLTRSAEYQDRLRIARADKILDELKTSASGLKPNEIINAKRLIRDKAKELRDNGVSGDEMRRELDAYASELKSDLEKRSLSSGKMPGKSGNLGGPALPEQPAVPEVKIPKAGDVLKGYRFKGGDPADQNAWEPAG